MRECGASAWRRNPGAGALRRAAGRRGSGSGRDGDHPAGRRTKAEPRSRGQQREMNTQQPSRPVITPAMREQAAKQPNTWLYVVDPIFTDPGADVPPWGFIGGYRVDERGELTDDFSPNPTSRPP